MCRWILAGSLLLTASTAAAQGFYPPTTVTIDYITQGRSYELRPIEAAPDIPGRELLVYFPVDWTFTIARWHPTKHGFNGALAGPGLCAEPYTQMVIAGQVWHYNTSGDVTGDGLDDVVVYLQSGRVDVYANRGLTSCR